MTVSIDELRERVPRSQALDFIFSQLSSIGFNVSGWKSDSKQHKFLRAFSTVWSDLSETVRQVADFTLNRYATGTPLTELARSNFGNVRHAAVATEGPYKLTNAGAVPYTLQPGQLLLQSENGVDFQSTTGGLLAANGGTLVVTIKALKAGAFGNVPNGSIKRLITSLAGVTGTNEAGPGDSVWYATAGTDEESVESLRLRNEDRLATLNQISMPGAGYRFIAMSVPGIERVKVDDTNPRGPGTLDVYIATSAGPAGAAQRDVVQAAEDRKRSPHANVLVKLPSERALNPAGTVHFAPGFNTKARKDEVLQIVKDYVDTLPIGGILLPPSTSGVMPLSELVAAMSQIPGVVAVNLTNPAGDVSLSPFELLSLGTDAGLAFIPEVKT